MSLLTACFLNDSDMIQMVSAVQFVQTLNFKSIYWMAISMFDFSVCLIINLDTFPLSP